MSKKLKRFGVSMEKDLLDKFDNVVSGRKYANRSEAVRDFVRAALVEEEWKNLKGQVIGTLTIIYDHHARLLSEKLSGIQHDHFDNIIAATHIHLDHDNCAEVIILKGKGSDVKKISDRLIGTKGVKHGKLAMASTGKNIS